MKQIIFGGVACVLAAGSVVGDEDTQKDEQSALEKALMKYERTGEVKKCINPTRIRHSRVVDDFHIIFEMTGRKSYLSTLPRKCHSLDFHKSIKYTVRGGSLCRNDLFEVFNSTGIHGPTCSFGEFEELKLKPKKEKDEKAEMPKGNE